MTEQKQIDEYKEIVKIMKTCADTKNLYEVFTDFIKLMAYDISSVVDLSTKDERVKKYQDTLTLETYSTWFTPFFVWGDWGSRLKLKQAFEKMRAIMEDKAV